MQDLLHSGWDMAALGVFALAWLAYEPLLRVFARGRHVINGDLVVIRTAWMRQMMARPHIRLLDSQLIGHALNAASFFASSNLILIAGAAGVLFGGQSAYRRIENVPLLAHGEPVLFGIKLALVAITLARGLLAFIWAIRQLNYCAAVIGAAPREGPQAVMDAYGDAAAAVLTPALSASNAGVRGYYFALAAAAWLFGPFAFMATTVGAVSLLAWRQAFSPAARAVRKVRALLEGEAHAAEALAATAPETGAASPSA